MNIGLLACGHGSATFHAPASVAGLKLNAVANRQPEHVRFAWPEVRVHASTADLMAQADINLVVIPTPDDTHATLAQAAGKHVVVDKPFTLNAAKAQHLIAPSRQQRRLRECAIGAAKWRARTHHTLRITNGSLQAAGSRTLA